MKGRKIKREVVAPKRGKKVKKYVRLAEINVPPLRKFLEETAQQKPFHPNYAVDAIGPGTAGYTSQARGDRHNTSKPRMSLILEAQHAFIGVTRVLEFGEKKYSRANWRKGLPSNEIVDSLARHLVAFQSGETHDHESKLPLVDHILCNALFLAELVRPGSEWDDRPILRNPRN